MRLKTQNKGKQDRIRANTEKNLLIEAHRGYGKG